MHCFCSIWFIIWIASYIVLNRVPLAISISMLECHWLSNVLLSMLDLMIVFSDSLINHWACMQLQLNKNLIWKLGSEDWRIKHTRVVSANQLSMKLAGLKSIEDAHEESVWAVTWVPSTETRPALLLTGSLDETVRLWQPDELVNRGKMTGHCLGVASVAAHPSGHIAASASLDSFVRVFDVDSNNTIASLEAPPSEVWQLRFNPQVPLQFSNFS